MDIRTVPDMNGPRTTDALQPGATFCVSEECPTKEGITYLKLADGRGWVFDRKPGIGFLCARKNFVPDTPPGAGPLPHTTKWCYSPEVVAPMDIRAGPDVNGPRTAHRLQPGDVFGVSEEITGA